MITEITVLPTKKAMVEYLSANVNSNPAVIAVVENLGGRRRNVERLREMIRSSYERRSEVIETAHSDSTSALLCHDALVAEADAMSDAGQDLPASLRVYMARREKWPKRKAGRSIDEWEHWERDIAYLVLLSAACQTFGLHPTHNEANDKPAGTEVTAALLRTKWGIKISPKRLAAILTRERKWAKSMGWWVGN